VKTHDFHGKSDPDQNKKGKGGEQREAPGQNFQARKEHRDVVQESSLKSSMVGPMFYRWRKITQRMSHP
jgi:hypothetical protein